MHLHFHCGWNLTIHMHSETCSLMSRLEKRDRRKRGSDMTEHSWRIRQWNKYSDTAPTDIEPTSDWLSKLVRIRIGDAGVLQGGLFEHIFMNHTLKCPLFIITSYQQEWLVHISSFYGDPRVGGLGFELIIMSANLISPSPLSFLQNFHPLLFPPGRAAKFGQNLALEATSSSSSSFAARARSACLVMHVPKSCAYHHVG